MHKRRACEAIKVIQPSGHNDFLASKAMTCLKIFTGVDVDAARSGRDSIIHPAVIAFP